MHPHQAVLAVIDDYFRGLFAGNIELLRRTFHPSAVLFGEVKGEPYLRPLEEYLQVVAQRQSPQQLGEEFRMRALAVDVLGDIANVRVHCPMLGFNYYDYLALARHHGDWRIVNKLFTHVPS